MVWDYEWEVVCVVCLVDCVWCVVDLFCDLVVGEYCVGWDIVDYVLYVMLECVVDIGEWQVEVCGCVFEIMFDLFDCVFCEC